MRSIMDKSLLKTGGYLPVNKKLLTLIGINETILFETLVYIRNDFYRKNKLDDGWFYAISSYITDLCGLSDKQIRAAGKKLVDKGLLLKKFEYYKGKRVNYYKPLTKKSDDILKGFDGAVTTNVLDPNSWVFYNSFMAKDLSPSVAIVFDDILTSYLNIDDYKIEDDGWFKNVQTSVANRLGVTKQIIVTKYVPILEEAGLLEKKQMGYPRSTYIRLNEEKIKEYFDKARTSYMEDVKLKMKDSTPSTEASYSTEEKITRELIDKANNINNLSTQWTFKYSYVDYVKEHMEKYDEEKLFEMLEYAYNYYLDKATRIDKNKYSKLFTFENIFYSIFESWVKRYDEEKSTTEKDEIAYKTTSTILDKIKYHTKNKFNWDLKDNKIRLIKKRLAEGLTEDELINHAISRYDFLVKAGYSMKSFNFAKLFGDECYDQIKSQRDSKVYTKNNSSSSKTRDGVVSKSISQKDLDFQAILKEAGEVY